MWCRCLRRPEASDVKLEFQAVVSCLAWALETERRSSTIAVPSLNC